MRMPRLFLIDDRAPPRLLRPGAPAAEPLDHQGRGRRASLVSVLLRLLESQAPEYLAISFDTGRTFRDDLYPEYKATRDKMPDDLRLQLDRIRQVVLAFGIPILEAEGFEADDVLGTIARRAAEQGVRVVILSGDRDLLQLVDDSIHVELAGQSSREAIDYGPQAVFDKFGVSPGQLVDYKALVGDTSDNIPGVKGIGEKTAVGLIQQYGSLEAIYQNLGEVPERFRTKLEQGREQAYLSRRLVTIELEVPIEFDLEACRAHEYDRARVVELFRELEFRSLLTRIAPEAEGPSRESLLQTSAAPPSPWAPSTSSTTWRRSSHSPLACGMRRRSPSMSRPRAPTPPAPTWWASRWRSSPARATTCPSATSPISPAGRSCLSTRCWMRCAGH
jgi:5'-3' exonuclease